MAQSSANGRITGTVTYIGDGSLIHGASVRVSKLNRVVTTNEEGKFTIENLPPGSYTLIVHQEGFADITRVVEVGSGQTVVSDFALSLAGVKEQVTVTASGVEQSLFEAIASVSAVDSTEISQKMSVGLGEVINGEPGVAKRSDGPGAARPVIRGFDGDRVLVATDGTRTGSLGSQSGDHSETVDLFSAERIEVVKGPATLLYGSNAIGGVVNVISGHDEGAHPGLRGRFTILGSSNSNQFSSGGGIEYGKGPWMVWGNASGQRTGDYKAGGDFGTVENTYTRSAAASFGGGYFGNKGFINSSYSYYQNRYGIPFDPDEADEELRSLRSQRHNLKFNGGFSNLDSFIESAKFTFDFSNYRHQELVGDEVGTTFRNKIYSYRGLMDQKKYGILTGRFGFDGFQRNYSINGDETLVTGPVKQNSFAVFTLQELNFERVTMQFGARVENNRYRPQSSQLRERDFTGFSGAAGIRVGLWKDGAFVANYSHAYRAPALEELYNNGPHDGTLSFEIGNPNLKAETSDGIDLSLRQQGKRLRAEANYFYYRLKNFVFLAPTGDIDDDSGLPIAEFLQGDSRFTGTEINLDFDIADWLTLETGLDYVNARLENGTPLPRIAPLRGKFALDAHYKNFSFRPEFIAVNSQTKVFTNETPTAGYGVFNLTANYVVTRKHYANIFSVDAFNLGNKLYYNHISFLKQIAPEIGRGVRFSYTIRFF
ncbi:MAG TPA: TonB-dependent receptor [Pyrinomonadaceae bacterium]|nr:TonB-dependent receptor [Pyrinomonadaceae bacterium]